MINYEHSMEIIRLISHNENIVSLPIFCKLHLKEVLELLNGTYLFIWNGGSFLNKTM